MTFDLLAHAGGFSWDETLFLLLPIVVFGLLLAAAKRKGATEADEDENPEEGASGRTL